MSKPAVFLDRDGTLFKDTGYPGDKAPIHFLPGVPEYLRKLQTDFELIIISNQSGVGRGIITKDEMYRVHDKMINKLQKENIKITDSYYCPHAPSDNCVCRKPLPFMIQNAAKIWAVNLNYSYMIGDKLSDVLAGYRAGCKSVLLGKDRFAEENNTERPYPYFVATDFKAAAEWILNDANNLSIERISL